jgi:hypothetical protein
VKGQSVVPNEDLSVYTPLFPDELKESRTVEGPTNSNRLFDSHLTLVLF